ncbi:MAG: DNA repair ATPase [Myxococcota bacterium]
MSTQDEVGTGGNYEVVRDRLQGLGEALRQATDDLNTRRQATFGSTELAILGHERVRTENHCVPCDIVQVGGALLFGYNVHLGLKRNAVPQDVFSLQTYAPDAPEGSGFHTVTDHRHAQFLADRGFAREFEELYQYYKDARLIQLRVTETKLLAIFQTGATARDVKVLRWAVDPDGSVTYLDNRGERDHVFPPTHDFAWTPTTRADHVLGRHPHVNVLDTVFVETIGGDLTVKVDDNTDDGRGIFSEPVDDPDQSLDDAEIHYAKLGQLVLLKVRPFRETAWRYLVFNINTRTVLRIDAIGQSCVQLPEDHGILFPGGTYLRTGEVKVFDDGLEELEFVRSIQAPNGEDLLYVFHRRRDGLYALYPYNVVRKEVTNPITAHGYSLFDDGTLIVFRADGEPTRVHPVQIWRTPFVSAEVHEATPSDGSLLGRIGNRDLVRGISEAYTLCRMVANQEPTRAMYEELVRACTRFVDGTYWSSEAEVGDLAGHADAIRGTAELVIDEFEKVQILKQRAEQVMAEAQRDHDALLASIRPHAFDAVESFLGAMTELRAHRGRLITLRDVRYVDVGRIDALETATVEAFDRTTEATVAFLLGDDALAPLRQRLDALLEQAGTLKKTADFEPLLATLDEVGEGVQLLAEVTAQLDVADATEKTRLLDGISEVVAHGNRTRAVVEQARARLRSSEDQAEFAAQFRLFGQSVQSALALCDTPETCDEQLSRMLLQLEELEARFGEDEGFLEKLGEKREEVYDALTARKQGLLDARQRRVGQLVASADRILGGVQRRATTFDSEEALQSWFAADSMVAKLRQIAAQLVELGDTVKADEVESKLLRARQDALRALRDQIDLFDADDLIRLGKHRFTVNRQPLQLTLVPHPTDAGDPGLALHLNGTDFTEPVDDPAFATTQPYWDQVVVSEDPATYRAEYLAACMLHDGLVPHEPVLDQVRDYAANRYDEGYDRGVHDHDAAKVFSALHTLVQTAGRLRFSAHARALATLFWAFGRPADADVWRAEARSLARLREAFGPTERHTTLLAEWRGHLDAFCDTAGFGLGPHLDAAPYLFEELARDELRFAFRHDASDLNERFTRWLEDHGGQHAFDDALQPLGDEVARRYAVTSAWMRAFASAHEVEPTLALEAATLRVLGARLDVHVAGTSGHTVVEGLLGRHRRVQDGRLDLQLDAFLDRLRRFRTERVPGYRAYREARQALLERERRRLRLDEFEPKVMSAFVRNRLVNEVYLPLVGDNLAKQIGAAGGHKRTDLMGLLLLVSPPGYGKTTLMEYVASRLGLTFVKVNGPALGHDVTSLDPSEAPNATARQEVDKINLALEMGNNVLLYLDDIQHCHPELLQKFISLCDAQRRIEGVWRARTQTYDLRGKKFAVVMAGNPYTESGDRFQIPDMLANRADTYNLGDVLSGRETVFAMSFIENALTSNATLAPLASRSMDDVYALMRRARGEPVADSELSHEYSAVELEEITWVLRHLFRCRDVLLSVNAEYVRSAAMEDAYRTEPRFQLQGSYRNMNKLAEKIVAVMTDEEVEALITDHYTSEAQTLTTGAEANLLKLGALRGTLDATQQARWEAIRTEFQRQKLVGGSDADPATRIGGVLSQLVAELRALRTELTERLPVDQHEDFVERLEQEVRRAVGDGTG